MDRNKKHPALVLALALAMLLCLAACGGTGSTGNPGASGAPGTTDQPDPSDNAQTPLLTAEEFVARWGLEGKWSLYAWNTASGDHYTEETDDFYLFSGSSVTYIDDNTEIGTWELDVTGENSLNLTGPTFTSWTITFDRVSGDLVISDPVSSLIYYCTPALDLPDPFYTHATPVNPITLEGKWSINGWVVKSSGTFSPSTGQSFLFEGTRLGYYIGENPVYVNGYYFDDPYNIGLRTEGADRSERPQSYLTLSMDPMGRLLVEDSDNSIIYVCDKVPFVPEDNYLLGSWKVNGWTSVATSQFTLLGDAGVFFFTENTRTYLLNGEISQPDSPYEWLNENTILITVDGATVKLTVSLTEDGELLMSNLDGTLLFYCTRAEEDGSGTGGDSSSVLPAPFYIDAIPVTLEGIQGKWAITGLTAMADGSFSPLEGQSFLFEGNLLKSFAGDTLLSTSTVYFDDPYNLGLRSEGASQREEPSAYRTIYENEAGQLLIEDPHSAVIYVCEFVVPGPEVDPSVVTPRALLGDWVVTGYTIPSTGHRTDLDYEAVFSFNQDSRRYYVNGRLSNTWKYVWEDEDTIIISMLDGNHRCDIYFNEAGLLCITDPRYGDLYYICRRR